MKYGDTFILRGSMDLPNVGTFDAMLIVDDGVPTFGYRIKSFKLVPQSYEGQAVMHSDAMGYLSTNDPSLGISRFLFSDPAQMAWAMFDNTTGSGMESDPSFMLIDPAVFVRELHLRCWGMPNTASGSAYNYFIEIQRVTLTDIEALVHLATEVNS
jgi:hypothetical protein